MGLLVVVDTNVFVSIFQFGGRISEILDLPLQGAVELCTSRTMIGFSNAPSRRAPK